MAAAGEFTETEHAAIKKTIDATVKDVDAVNKKFANGASQQEADEALNKTMAPIRALVNEAK